MEKIIYFSGDVGWTHAGFGNELCPFCKSLILDIAGPWTNLTNRDRYNGILKKQGYSLVHYTVSQCVKCRWWEVHESNYNNVYSNYSRDIYSQSIIKKFDLGSKEIPIELLGRYLSGKADYIFHIHDRKMEELVGAVLSEHFDCEVIHCGKSYDRGIDLLMIVGEDLIPIQVKRRMKPGPE